MKLQRNEQQIRLMKSIKKFIAAWLLICGSMFSVSAGILQPGDIVFADGGLDMVIRLDPVTGATNHIAAVDFPDSTGGIAVGRNGDIYAMRAKLGFSPAAEFFRIDGQTGAINKLSNQTLLYTGRRMKVSPDGLSLIVAGESQTGGRGIFRVDIATGQQSVITTNLTDFPDYERPWDVAFSPQGHIYMTDWNFKNLLRFNSDGAGRQLVSEDGLFQFIGGIDVGSDGTIYVADRNHHGIIRVDPDTGEQASVTTFGFMTNPSDITVAPDGTLIVADASADVIVRIDPLTGQQTLLHSGTPGPRSPCVFSPPAPPPPSLDVRFSANSIIVRWSDPVDEWQLQTCETLASDSWSGVGIVPDVDGEEREVTVQPDGDALYFRLTKP